MPPIPKTATTPKAPGRVPLQQPPPRWEECTVKLSCDQDDQLCTVEFPAMAYGPIAIHEPTLKNHRVKGWWTLSHRATGLALVTVSSEDHAVRLAEAVVRHGGKALDYAGPEDVLYHLPRWVRPWIRACRQARGWVDPTPYETGKVADNQDCCAQEVSHAARTA